MTLEMFSTTNKLKQPVHIFVNREGRIKQTSDPITVSDARLYLNGELYNSRGNRWWQLNPRLAIQQIIIKLHDEFSDGSDDVITAYNPVNTKWLLLS